MHSLFRALVVAIVTAQLVVAEPAPAFAMGQAIGPPGASEANALAPGIVVQKTKKKKTSSSSSSSSTNNVNEVTVSIDKPGHEPNRGELGVFVRVVTNRPGLICRLVIKYRNGAQDSPDNVANDGAGICIFHFDVPDKSSVVGDADLVVTALDTANVVHGEAKRTIQIRD